jgi:hypothetical protein
METELIELICQREYHELSAKEKKALLNWCSSEEAFRELKILFVRIQQLNAMQEISPNPHTKRRLDALYAKQYPKRFSTRWNLNGLNGMYPINKPLYLRPLIQVAAVVMISLLSLPFLFTSDKQTIKLAKLEPRVQPTTKEHSLNAEKPTQSAENAGNQLEEKTVYNASPPQVLAADDAPIMNGLLEESPVSNRDNEEEKVLGEITLGQEMNANMLVRSADYSVNRMEAVNSPSAVFELLTVAF